MTKNISNYVRNFIPSLFAIGIYTGEAESTMFHFDIYLEKQINNEKPFMKYINLNLENRKKSTINYSWWYQLRNLYKNIIKSIRLCKEY